MSPPATGPVATMMIERLTRALSPTRLDLDDQSASHIGHAGHDGRGESHFALTIESAAFAGLTRVARQRAVYAALGVGLTITYRGSGVINLAYGAMAMYPTYVYAELRATGNYRRIAAELWPWLNAPPSTPAGEADAKWRSER